MEKTLQFGAAVRDITPRYPVWLPGYASRDHKSTGVAGPIQIGALAVSDGKDKAVIVACDLIGLKLSTCAAARGKIAARTGLSADRIMIACSHTHFAPTIETGASMSAKIGFTEPDPRFAEDFNAKTLEVVEDSLRALAPARLLTARVRVPALLFNRRTVKKDGKVENNYVYPDHPEDYVFGPCDDELTILKVMGDDGVRAVLLNFGCHPVTGGEVQDRDHYRISADYPGYVREVIAREYGCPVFFTLGAAGDTVPVKRYGPSRRQIGEALGNTVLLAEKMFVEAKPEFRADSVTVPLKTLVALDPEKARREFEAARAASMDKVLETTSDSKKNADLAMSDPYAKALTWYRRSQLYPENRQDISLQCLKLGPLALVAFPFEVVCEISRRLKTACPNAALVSCANGYQGYLPLAEDFARGGYEADPMECHFQENAGDLLLEAAIRWAKENA